MAGTNSTIYLDTCFVLDWLTHNQNRPDSYDVGGIIGAINDNKLNAVTSVITKLEVLQCKTSPTMWDAWQRFQSRKNVQMVPFTERASDIAMRIRDYYQKLRDADSIVNKKPPETPDCIHIATAILMNVDRMVTFDKGGLSPQHLSPIELSGVVAGRWPLEIQKPKSALLMLNV